MNDELLKTALFTAFCILFGVFITIEHVSEVKAETTQTKIHVRGPGKFPVEFELVPNKLKVRIYSHEIETPKGKIPCWSYVSEGLQAYRHQELIFTLARKPEEQSQDFPRDIFTYFMEVLRFAEKGNIVTAGGFSELGQGSPGVLRPDFRAFTYINPCPIEGIDTRNHLAAILLTSEELSVAKAFGVTRVLANLGEVYRFYPTAFWCDRERKSVLSLEMVEQASLLAKMKRMTFPGARLIERDHQIFLKLPQGAHLWLKTNLSGIPAKEVYFTLFTNADPLADCCLVWKPGQTGPAAIAPPDTTQSRKTGNYIGFLGGQAENGVKLIEDGFMIILTEDSWNKVKKALFSEKPVSIPMEDKAAPNFSIEWIKPNEN